jgi:release factor glutamine methyltransferase
MTIGQAEKQLVSDLTAIYEQRESSAIADLVMEHISGYPKIDRIIHKMQILSIEKESLFQQFQGELMKHRPVQYVLGEAWFMGLRFHVNEQVLIPRPETEELVNWVVEEIRSGQTLSPRILDVGTGSGCIPVALGKQLPTADIHSCDISGEALGIARGNALKHGVSIDFMEGDFLDQTFRQQLPAIDCIVSNPPYIPVRDRHSMSRHVVNYEPSIALFVPDEDPLIFYRAIAGFAGKKLLPGGKIFAELHIEASEKAKQLFASEGFKDIEIKNDLHGNPRMIKATMLP